MGTLLPPRLVLIFMVAECSHCTWILEQPQGSQDVLPYHNRLDWFFNTVAYVAWPQLLYTQVVQASAHGRGSLKEIMFLFVRSFAQAFG